MWPEFPVFSCQIGNNILSLVDCVVVYQQVAFYSTKLDTCTSNTSHLTPVWVSSLNIQYCSDLIYCEKFYVIRSAQVQI